MLFTVASSERCNSVKTFAEGLVNVPALEGSAASPAGGPVLRRLEDVCRGIHRVFPSSQLLLAIESLTVSPVLRQLKVSYLFHCRCGGPAWTSEWECCPVSAPLAPWHSSTPTGNFAHLHSSAPQGRPAAGSR